MKRKRRKFTQKHRLETKLKKVSTDHPIFMVTILVYTFDMYISNEVITFNLGGSSTLA